MNKKTALFCLLILISITGISQVPGSPPLGISYQAIARNFITNSVIINKDINVKFEIIDKFNNVVLYEETTNKKTNLFGLFTHQIGTGNFNPIYGSFSNIDWTKPSIQLSVSIDTLLNGNYVHVNNSQFVSVPYAFYAAKAELNLTGKDGYTIYYNGATSKWDTTSALLVNKGAWGDVTIPYKANIKRLQINNTYTLPINPGNPGDILTYGNSNAVSWAPPAAPTGLWKIGGNAGTSPGTGTNQHFVGTSDAADLVLASNQNERVRLLANGRIGIGTSNPSNKLEISFQDLVNTRFTGIGNGNIVQLYNERWNRLTFLHKDDSAFIASNTSNKVFLFDNSNMEEGKMHLYTDERMSLKADTFWFEKSLNSASQHARVNVRGIVNTDSLRVYGANSTKTNWVLSNDGTGKVKWTDPVIFADHLGNHIMQKNLNTNSFWLSGDGNASGIFIKSDGKVGVGLNNPTSVLTINGDAEVKAGYDFRYEKPKQHYYSIDATAFKEINISTPASLSSPLQFTGISGEIAAFTTPAAVVGYLIAPVHLPDGAIINSISMYCYDADASNDLTVNFFRSQNLNPLNSVITEASVQTTGSQGSVSAPQLRTITATLSPPLIIDNQNNSYKVGISFDVKGKGAAELGVRRVVINYSVSVTD